MTGPEEDRLLTVELCVQVIAGDLGQLQTQHSQTLAKLDDYKRKHLELSHRLLKVNCVVGNRLWEFWCSSSLGKAYICHYNVLMQS